MKKIFPIILTVAIATLVGCEKNEVASPQSNTNSLSSARYIPGGKGGSMARFAIIDNYMYAVDHRNLKIFDITTPDAPKLMAQRELSLGVETVYPMNDQLYIGTERGLYIYDVTNPIEPQEIGNIEHVLSCDPVVADQYHAYVTLRGGTECGTSLNQLDVYDITDPSAAEEQYNMMMSKPYGLGISEATKHTLFVCDGNDGIKVIDISDPTNLVEIQTQGGVEAYDVIPHNNNLIVSAKGKIIQYDVSDSLHFKELSVINLY